jgi:hypothetical protein
MTIAKRRQLQIAIADAAESWRRVFPIVNNAFGQQCIWSTMHLSATAMHAARAILAFSRFYRELQRVTAA